MLTELLDLKMQCWDLDKQRMILCQSAVLSQQ